MENINIHRYFSDTLVNAKNIHMLEAVSKIMHAIEQNEYSPFNPVIIRGKSGTGKTHILKKIAELGDMVKSYHTQELKHLLQNHTNIFELCEKNKQYKCLIIDDIHLLTDELTLQKEFAYIIEYAIENNLNIIISMSIDNNIKELGPELNGRINMGLVLNVPEPDLDLRMRYVQAFSEANSIKLTKEHILIIARKCSQYRSIRSGVINLIAFNKKTNSIPDVSDLEKILTKSGLTAKIDTEQILRIVSVKYGFNIKDLRGKKRDSRLIEARQVAMYLCRKIIGTTYKEIAEYFGGKDHTTIMYAYKKIENLQAKNKDMDQIITEIMNQCKNEFI